MYFNIKLQCFLKENLILLQDLKLVNDIVFFMGPKGLISFLYILALGSN